MTEYTSPDPRSQLSSRPASGPMIGTVVTRMTSSRRRTSPRTSAWPVKLRPPEQPCSEGPLAERAPRQTANAHAVALFRAGKVGGRIIIAAVGGEDGHGVASAREFRGDIGKLLADGGRIRGEDLGQQQDAEACPAVHVRPGPHATR